MRKTRRFTRHEIGLGTEVGAARVFTGDTGEVLVVGAGGDGVANLYTGSEFEAFPFTSVGAFIHDNRERLLWTLGGEHPLIHWMFVVLLDVAESLLSEAEADELRGFLHSELCVMVMEADRRAALIQRPMADVKKMIGDGLTPAGFEAVLWLLERAAGRGGMQ